MFVVVFGAFVLCLFGIFKDYIYTFDSMFGVTAGIKYMFGVTAGI